MTLLVPSWDYQPVTQSVQTIYTSISEMRHAYERLFAIVPAQLRYRIKIKKDNHYYDTYSDCIEKLHLASVVDP